MIALAAGVTRLIEAGVTGRIVIANVASFRGMPVSVQTQRQFFNVDLAERRVDVSFSD